MQPVLPLLTQWARRRDQPITVFDLETTTYVPYVAWMGVTEVGLLTFFPDGGVAEEQAFVDPERKIPKEVTALTGISRADVAGQPNWSVWATRLHMMADSHVMVGYCSADFDCPVVVTQNERYGVSGTQFRYSLDVHHLPGVNGSLTTAADAHGIAVGAVHRAMADVRLTAALLEAVASKHGLDVLDAHVGTKPVAAKSETGPKQQRQLELEKHYAATGTLPPLGEFAAAHGVQRTTIENDVVSLVTNRRLPPHAFTRPALQAWLAAHLPSTLSHCWGELGEHRLKPVFEFLQGLAPPEPLDYAQLKIAVWMLESAAGQPYAEAAATPLAD